MKNLVIIYLCMFSFALNAQNKSSYLLQKSGDQYIALPKSGGILLETINKSPNCKLLYRGLEDLEARVRICKRSDKNVNSCYSLKTKLYDLIWDQEISTFGFSNPQYIELSSGDVQISRLPRIDTIAFQKNVEKETISLASAEISSDQQSSYRLVNRSSKWSTALDGLKLQQDVLEVKSENDKVLLNKLQYCELEKDKISLSVVKKVDYQYQLNMPIEKAETYYDLYKKMDIVNDHIKEYGSIEKATVFGLLVGKYIASKPQLDDKTALKTLFKFTRDDLSLKTYSSLKAMIKALPREPGSLEGEINVQLRL